MGVIQDAEKLTAEILAKTKTMMFSGDPGKDEEDVAAYVKLIGERELLIEQLQSLSIDEEVKSSPGYQKVKQTITEIIRLDRQHLAFIEEMHDTIKAAYRLVKQGQRIHKGYASLPPDSVSMWFDVKK